MIKIWKKLAFFCISADPMRIYFATNMVRMPVVGKLGMHKQCTKRAIPLDVVPERRTKRYSPRCRPGYRFCEPSFRYLLSGSEGEKCRPLDHRCQIPFIHSVRVFSGSNLYIYIYMQVDIALWYKNQIEHSIWDESLLFCICAERERERA